MISDIPVASLKRRKVLFVNHAAVLGGAELTLLDLANAYQESSQVLLFSEGPFQDRLKTVGVMPQVLSAANELLDIRTSSGLTPILSAFPALLHMAREVAAAAQGFDVIHANSQKAFIATAMAALLFRCPPVVWYLQDLLSAPRFSGINRRTAIMLANLRADQVIVNSKATGQDFVAMGGQGDRVRLLYPGLSSRRFEAVESDSIQSLRASLGVGQAPLVGLFSRISFIKGHHILLEAVRQSPGVHVLFVGDALFGEDEYLARIHAIAGEPEFAGRVHWLGFRDDVPALMSACDVLVDASTEFNSFGRVIVEGQLAGVPVIATAGGAARELIEPGVTGYIVPAGDEKTLAATIQQLIKDPGLSQAIAQKAHTSAQAQFSIETHVQTYSQILHELLITKE